MSIDELIEALEAATDPCHELDCRIEECIRPGVRCVIGDFGAECTYDCNLWWEPGAYTASIDDALTLVPEGRLWSLGAIANGSGFVAILDNDGRSHRGATPAIALCIAALEARKALADA